MSLVDSFHSVLNTLQTKSLLGFPYLYWGALGLVVILLCCCITCCLCCRRKRTAKRRQSAEKHLRSTEMTTVTATQRQSLNNNDKRFMKRESYQTYNQYKKASNRNAPSAVPQNSQSIDRQQVPSSHPQSHQYKQQQYPPNQYGNADNIQQNQYRNDNNINANRQHNNAGFNAQNNPNFNQNVNSNSYRNDNEYRNNDNQYGNNPNMNQYGNNQYDNSNSNQNNNNQYGNNDNYNQNINDNSGNRSPQQAAAKFGFSLPNNIYNPKSADLSSPPAVRSNSAFERGYNDQSHGYSHSPQPQQSYGLAPQNEYNNYPSHSAPAPHSHQIHELQQQYPPPSHDDEDLGPPLPNDKEQRVQGLGDGNRKKISGKEWRKEQQKKSKNKHFTKMSDINEAAVKKMVSTDNVNMKMEIQTTDVDKQVSFQAPPKRSRQNKGQRPRVDSLNTPVDSGGYGGLSQPKFRKKGKKKDASVNADEYSDSEERAKISSWDARRSSVLATDLQHEKADPFQGRRRSVFDESSSEEEEVNDGRRLTVDLTNAENRRVSGHMGNLGNYQ